MSVASHGRVQRSKLSRRLRRGHTRRTARWTLRQLSLQGRSRTMRALELSFKRPPRAVVVISHARMHALWSWSVATSTGATLGVVSSGQLVAHVTFGSGQLLLCCSQGGSAIATSRWKPLIFEGGRLRGDLTPAAVRGVSYGGLGSVSLREALVVTRCGVRRQELLHAGWSSDHRAPGAGRQVDYGPRHACDLCGRGAHRASRRQLAPKVVWWRQLVGWSLSLESVPFGTHDGDWQRPAGGSA